MTKNIQVGNFVTVLYGHREGEEGEVISKLGSLLDVFFEDGEIVHLDEDEVYLS